MPRAALTDARIRKAKPQAKPFTLFDGGRLFLLVNPNGSKLWRLAYVLGGKENRLALGSYPEVSLQEARQSRDEAKKLIRRGVNPAHHRKQEKAMQECGAGTTFAMVATALIDATRAKGRTEGTLDTMGLHLRQAAAIADRPIAEITANEVLTLLRAVHARVPDTALRLQSWIGSVFRFGVVNLWCPADPTVTVRGALTAPPPKHYPAITTAKQFGALLRAIDAYVGSPQVMFALRIAPHVALRPGELRKAEWSEIDFDKAVWIIPAERMKGRREHALPLSCQMLALLRELHTITGTGDFLFPGRSGRCLSEATLNVALGVMGFKDVHCAHGFRASFSSICNASGLWSEDSIERQLAHVVGSKVRRAYQRDAFWLERVRLAQWWSDRIDEMRDTLPSESS